MQPFLLLAWEIIWKSLEVEWHRTPGPHPSMNVVLNGFIVEESIPVLSWCMSNLEIPEKVGFVTHITSNPAMSVQRHNCWLSLGCDLLQANRRTTQGLHRPKNSTQEDWLCLYGYVTKRAQKFLKGSDPPTRFLCRLFDAISWPGKRRCPCIHRDDHCNQMSRMYHSMLGRVLQVWFPSAMGYKIRSSLKGFPKTPMNHWNVGHCRESSPRDNCWQHLAPARCPIWRARMGCSPWTHCRSNKSPGRR